MKKLILLLILVVALSGCTMPDDDGDNNILPPVTYKNDIITVEEYSAYPANPDAGDQVRISFSVKNNGDKKVDWVEVNFFSVTQFIPVELDCDGAAVSKPEKGNLVCRFEGESAMGSFDSRAVMLTLDAPKGLLDSAQIPVSFSVKYGYSGARIGNIPVIDGKERRSSSAKFTQSDPTYGPVVVDFVPPTTRERVENNQVIKESWIVAGQSFDIKLQFKHVGGSVGMVKPIKIEKGDVNLTLNYLFKKEADECCEFGDEDGNYVMVSNTELLDIAKQKELKCCIQASPSDTPEISATLVAEFSYVYEFIRIEIFNVQRAPSTQ